MMSIMYRQNGSFNFRNTYAILCNLHVCFDEVPIFMKNCIICLCRSFEKTFVCVKYREYQKELIHAEIFCGLILGGGGGGGALSRKKLYVCKHCRKAASLGQVLTFL